MDPNSPVISSGSTPASAATSAENANNGVSERKNWTDQKAWKDRNDPYTSPQYTFGNRVRRQLWSIVWIFLYRPSPRVAHAWRACLLRCFGAKLGPHCRFYPASRVWAPWNLSCEDTVMVADEAELYNPAPMVLASHAIVSQGAYLCGATHDYNDPPCGLDGMRGWLRVPASRRESTSETAQF